ncbi:DUF192 domain-containing protein [Pelagibacterium luteolum]|uniref:DUF192 domain-containing protein n=1 Tax=Pelagibacterium luteolum TaxID=440168 RepID=A0A1G7WD35_9HYPH|nr:DUF192 domain-containing protein [Pelagibacterium luteolum]SDG69853.1 hypothetical protein SAMN04487974_10673 [Pelagibacterium luteolum]
MNAIFRKAGLALGLSLLAFSAVAQESEDLATIVSGDLRHEFTVEVVDTDETRSRGLMFVEELAPDAGMLFDFFEERPVAFWMQNTLIPLDMLFIKSDGEIARIHENAVPMDRTAIPSGEPVRFVLEIPGGRSAELGLEAGDTLEHPRVGTEAEAAVE